MASKKDNPLIGSFRAPVPDAPPPAGPAEGQKPAEPPKVTPDPKATGTAPAKAGEGQKPTEPPKGTPDHLHHRPGLPHRGGHRDRAARPRGDPLQILRPAHGPGGGEVL